MSTLGNARDCSRRAREAMADMEIELAKLQHRPVTVALEWVETPPECPTAGLYLLREEYSSSLGPDYYLYGVAELSEGEHMCAETWAECCGPIVIGGGK